MYANLPDHIIIKRKRRQEDYGKSRPGKYASHQDRHRATANHESIQSRGKPNRKDKATRIQEGAMPLPDDLSLTIFESTYLFVRNEPHLETILQFSARNVFAPLMTGWRETFFLNSSCTSLSLSG